MGSDTKNADKINAQRSSLWLRLVLVAVCLAVSPAVLAQPDGQLASGGGALAAALPQGLSPWGMYLQADWVVKAVMIGLIFASVITWTVFVAKTLELRIAGRCQRNVLSTVNKARTLAEADERLRREKSSPAAATELIGAAADELRLSADALGDPEGLKERIVSRLQRIEAAMGRRIGRGTGVLATIGATAPFVGLFGTVWGIMDSFIGISRSQTTSLAVIAPGIAEALLATALGLVAAIPAVVFYNHFARRMAAYKALVADTSAAVLRLASRDLSRGVAGKANLHAVAERAHGHQA